MNRIAIVIGHSIRSQGAANHNGLTEFKFNQRLALAICERGIPGAEIIPVYRDSYLDLPKKINVLNPDAIISLHCNAFNTKVSGTEVLYYHRSGSGQALAAILQGNLVSALNLPDRGIKPVDSEGRGGHLLKQTNAPCVIAEPFFIDNDADLGRAQERFNELVDAYRVTIQEFM